MRAVRSVLAQTFQPFEVVVVLDGPNELTQQQLEGIADPRIRLVRNPKSLGAAMSRNIGVDRSRGEWIAFLDDDDEWFPEKLQSQLDVARRSPTSFPVVASQFVARTPKGEAIWPRRQPRAGEPISEYIFSRNSFFVGEGIIQTSTILTPKALLQKLPLNGTMKRHAELDWLIRAQHLDGVEIVVVPQTLSTWQADFGTERKSISNINDWQSSRDWLTSLRTLMTLKAYSSALMTFVSPQAALQQDWQAFGSLLQDSLRLGRPRPIDFALFLSMWLIPQTLRQSIRQRFAGVKRALLRLLPSPSTRKNGPLQFQDLPLDPHRLDGSRGGVGCKG
jgi:hypothetical protein